jgi:predicted RNA-binding protein
LESTNKEKLVKSCDKITDDIVDLEEVASNQAIDMYRRFFNTEHANKEELLKQSTILPLLQEIRKNIP